MAVGNKHNENAVLSHEMQPEVYMIYLEQLITPASVALDMEMYADTIAVPSGAYGADGAYDGTTNPVTYNDVNRIRMRGEDSIGRYINFGAKGLAGETVAGNFAGAFNPFDQDIANATLNNYGTAELDVVNISRAWEDYEVPEGHEGILDQLNNYDTDLLGMYEISGHIKRFAKVKWTDSWTNLMMPTKDNMYMTKQMGEMAGMITEQYYRSQVIQAASQYRNATGGSIDASAGYDEFKDALDAVTEELEFFGANPIRDIIMGSTRVGSKTVDEGFRCLVNKKLKNWLFKMPDFIHKKDYAEPAKDPKEIGAYENVRFVTTDALWNDDVMAAAGGEMDPDLMLGDVMNTGGQITHYNFLVFGEKAYTMLQMRGRENYKLHVTTATPSKADPLGLFGTFGWTGSAGFMLPRQTFVWNIRVKIR